MYIMIYVITDNMFICICMMYTMCKHIVSNQPSFCTSHAPLELALKKNTHFECRQAVSTWSIESDKHGDVH